MDTLRELKFAIRRLLHEPQFTAITVLVLALGIGASTSIFSVVYNGVLAPYPYRGAERIVTFYVHSPNRPISEDRRRFSWPEFLYIRTNMTVFEDMISFTNQSVLFKSREGVEPLNAVELTANSFDFLGVQPLLGRPLVLADGDSTATPVLALNYRLWKTRFNGNPAILGTPLIINGQPRIVVAVMPARFQFGEGDIWVPIGLGPSEKGAIGMPTTGRDEQFYVSCVGRIRPHVGIKIVAANLQAAGERLAETYKSDYPAHFTMSVLSLGRGFSGDFNSVVSLLVISCLLVLMIAMFNATSLLLARAATQERAAVIRSLLGATRVHLFRHVLAESLVLGTAGCAVGCALSYGCLAWVRAYSPPHKWFPDEAVISLNPQALMFGIAATFLTVAICSIAPSLRILRVSSNSQWLNNRNDFRSDPPQRTFRAALVIAQVALSIVLLCCATLMMRTVVAVLKIDLGFQPQDLMVASLMTPEGRYKTGEHLKTYYEQILGRISRLPGVEAAAESIKLPLYPGASSRVRVLGKAPETKYSASIDLCSAGLFQTLGLRVTAGRVFTQTDTDIPSFVAVVNQKFARDVFGSESPIGHGIRVGLLDQIPDVPHGSTFTIIGVVSDMKNNWPTSPVDPAVYVPYSITGFADRAIVVRTRTDPTTLMPAIREQIWSVDRDVAIANMRTLESFMHELSYALPEFELFSFATFATVGFILSMIGVFGVISYIVAARSGEIGIRMALGAERGRILIMILSKGLLLTVTGVFVGLLLNVGISRFVASQIWGVSASDPWTYFGVSLLAIVVGLLACLVPAYRASTIDPLNAIRGV